MEARKIGYLRRVPYVLKEVRVPGVVKAMWNKLVLTGHVISKDGAYGLTAAGATAVDEFDASLSEQAIDIIRRVDAGEQVGRDKSVRMLLEAGLIARVPSGRIVVTIPGEQVLKSRNSPVGVSP